MKWSLKLGTVAGIGIFLHWTFLILLVGIFFMHLTAGHSFAVAMQGVAFVVAIFACIVLHELGHALTARRYHIQTRDITLLPIGGVARLERMPEDPAQELWVALAGPAVNVVIALVLFVILELLGGLAAVTNITLVGGNFLLNLMLANVFIVAFNLLPAFPMDGGRVLRAILARRMPYPRATRTAARVGQGMAILFGFASFFISFFLLFIALFVFIGAQEEAHMVQVSAVLKGVTVRQGMMTRFRTLAPADSLARAADQLLAGSQHDFPVLDGDQVVGILDRQDLVRGLSEGGRDAKVQSYMRPDCQLVSADDPLEKVLTRMQQAECTTFPVMNEGRLIGLLTRENVSELVMVNTALSEAEHAGSSA